MMANLDELLKNIFPNANAISALVLKKRANHSTLQAALEA
jgi:hypothetical protein